MAKLIESKLMDNEPYKSIMSLFVICKSYIPNYDGLTHAHILYALMDKKHLNTDMNREKQKEIKQYYDKIEIPSLMHDSIYNNSKLTEEQKQKLFEIFKPKKKHKKLKTIEDFYISDKFSLNSYELDKGCISGPQRLNEKLNSLIEIGWIKPTGEKRYRRYYAKKKFYDFINLNIMQAYLHKLNLKNQEFIIDELNKKLVQQLNEDRSSVNMLSSCHGFS